MNDNILDIGTILIHSILITSVSITKLGCTASFLSILASILINLFSSKIKSENCFIKSWLQQLSLCCYVSIASLGLSKFMEYYDSGQNYIHLIPTTIMPLVLPILVIVIISVLVILGLENSDILNTTSLFVFLISFTLFSLTAIIQLQWNLGNWKIKNDLFEKFSYGVVLWFSAFYIKFNYKKDIRYILISVNFYLAIIIILSILPQYKILDFISPLGNIYSIYKLFQVSLVTCCLGFGLYSVFIPAVENYFKIQAKIKNMTFSKNMPVFLTSLVSIIIMLFFNIEQLIYINSSALILSDIFEIGSGLIKCYKPVVKLNKNNFKISKSSNKYSYLDNNQFSIQEDSSSSDTDIDEVVEEYNAKINVLTSIDKKDPTLHTYLSFMITFSIISLLSLILSYEFQQSQTQNVIFLYGVIILLSTVLFFLPKNKNKHILTYMNEIFSYTTLLIYLKSVLSTVWVPLTIWSLTGFIYKYKSNQKIVPQDIQNININMMPITTKSERVQIINKNIKLCT